MLPKLADATLPSVNITRVNRGHKIDNSFHQGIHDLLCGRNSAPSKIAHLETDVSFLTIVKDMVRIVNSSTIMCGSKK